MQNFLLLVIVGFSAAFLAPRSRLVSRISKLSMAKLDIVGRDIEVTEPLKDKIESKIGSAIEKYKGLDVMGCHVVLRVHKFPYQEHHTSVTKKDSQITEVTAFLKGGGVVHVSDRSEDMYATIDMISHKLAQKLGRLKDKKDKKDTKKKGLKENVMLVEESMSMNAEEEEDDDFYHKYDVLEPVSETDLAPLSVDAAIAHLETIDSPFYVFRNKDTSDVNVVYKKAGGVGVFTPSFQS